MTFPLPILMATQRHPPGGVMPIKDFRRPTMPANHGSVSTARQTLLDVLPAQRERYHNAFCVNPYRGILYNALRSGIRCHCQGIVRKLEPSNLNSDGSARTGFLNEMLTGVPFGIHAPGERLADPENITTGLVPRTPPNSTVVRRPGASFISMDPPTHVEDPGRTPRLPDIFSDDTSPAPDRFADEALIVSKDSWTSDPTSKYGSTQISSGGGGVNGPVSDLVFEDVINELGFEPGIGIGPTDSACPVCFGTGYVGGYSVFGGWRRVLNYQVESAVLNAPNLDLNQTVPEITTSSADFKVTLPAFAIGVDAFRVWNLSTQVVSGLRVLVDGNTLTSERGILAYCDGREHTISVVASTAGSTVTFTHIEIQLDQTGGECLFDLARTSESSSLSDLIDRTDPMQIVVSPMIPVLRTGDLIAESSYWRVMALTNVTNQDTARRTVLGWSCQSRVVQPTEYLNLLPRRRRREQPSAPARRLPNIASPFPGAR